MPRSEPMRLLHPRPVAARRLGFSGLVLSVLLGGCAAPVKVVSECPEPAPVEAEDLSAWLMEEPPRPAQDWAARVIGQMYREDLEKERGLDASHPWWWLGPNE